MFSWAIIIDKNGACVNENRDDIREIMKTIFAEDNLYSGMFE